MIDVCICTYRRSSLEATLRSLAQQAPGTPSFRVIIADNDAVDHRRAEITALRDEFDLDIEYLHAPAGNISIARNACLDAATADWIAFIDDDELAEPAWLMSLWREASSADIIFGPVDAVYERDAPAWLVAGRFHNSAIGARENGWNGYSGNVLIRRSFIERSALRFDLAWGKSGGEDTLFFFKAAGAGATFAFADKAIVREPVPVSRASLRWLLQRRFRAGQTHGEIAGMRNRRLATGASAIAKFAVLCGAGLMLAWDRRRSARQWLRAALQAGVVASVLGFRPIALYGKPEAGR